MIYLKDFMRKMEKEKKEIDKDFKFLDRTKDQIRDVEREMEKNRKELNPVLIIDELKKIQELPKKLEDDDWEKIEQEIKKMN
ncbi:MAG: hypothetical protein PHW24_01100 [Candidatus Moranbacteria bacterium]|nr:hypothetical protein [Candidatus Moranbacteria bacterium]